MVNDNNIPVIHVSVGRQILELRDDNKVIFSAIISTARNGVGEVNGSECTPRGWHQIRAKIGHNDAVNTVFVGRRPTGEIYHPDMKIQYPERDWILTRIMWLSGLEPGFNRMGNVDTMRRYIYIHGSPDDDQLGVPGSHGCIKMNNKDVINLFNLVPVYTRILITE